MTELGILLVTMFIVIALMAGGNAYTCSRQAEMMGYAGSDYSIFGGCFYEKEDGSYILREQVREVN